MKYGTRGSVFPDTRGSALSSWSPLCNYWTAVNPSHFRLSIKRSVKFFYLAPICSAGTGQVSVLCSIASIHLHFFCTLRVRAPLRGWKCCSTFWSFLPPPLHCLLALASAQVTPKQRGSPLPFHFGRTSLFPLPAPAKSHLASSSSLPPLSGEAPSRKGVAKPNRQPTPGFSSGQPRVLFPRSGLTCSLSGWWPG